MLRSAAAAVAAVALLVGAPAATSAAPRAEMAATSPAVAAYAKRYQAFRTAWNPRVLKAQRVLDTAIHAGKLPGIRRAFASYATLVRANRTAFLRLRAPREIRPQVTSLATAVAGIATAARAGSTVTTNARLVVAIRAVNTAVARAGTASLALRTRVGLPA